MKRGRSGEVIRAYKAVTAGHVCQCKDTLAKVERGDCVPWPTFVDLFRLHRTCGVFQVMGVCEEILWWLILKEPQFQVPLMYSWRFLVSPSYKISTVRRGVMERGDTSDERGRRVRGTAKGQGSALLLHGNATDSDIPSQGIATAVPTTTAGRRMCTTSGVVGK